MPTADPMDFAAYEGDSLISYAATIRLELDHAGERYEAGGLGNMFTFPPYRREGFGRQVLDLATGNLKPAASHSEWDYIVAPKC
jgi:hypothetical protein